MFVPFEKAMLSKRVNVVAEPATALMNMPFASVFCTLSPVMFSVGVALGVVPTRRKNRCPEPSRWMSAPVFDAVSVPLIARPARSRHEDCGGVAPGAGSVGANRAYA